MIILTDESEVEIERLRDSSRNKDTTVASLRAEFAQICKEIEYLEMSNRHVQDDFALSTKLFEEKCVELAQARADIAGRDAALQDVASVLEEHAPPHNYDYDCNFHSWSCNRCAFDALLVRLQVFLTLANVQKAA